MVSSNSVDSMHKRLMINFKRYLSLTVKGKKYDNLVWYYQYPTHESAAVAGLLSFYNKAGVDILVDGVKV